MNSIWHRFLYPLLGRLLSKAHSGWRLKIMDREQDVIMVHCATFTNARTSLDWGLHPYF